MINKAFRYTCLVAMGTCLNLIDSVKASAQSQATLRISAYMPVICNITLTTPDTNTGLINQDCNTDHVINLRYDPSLIPSTETVTLSYAGRSVTLDTSGIVEVAQDGPIREKRTLTVSASDAINQTALQALINSFELDYSTL